MGNTTAIRIDHIDFNRAEGATSECGRHVFHTLEDANAHVKRAAVSAPVDGSYAKCDVRITWVDGSTWAFRLDLTFHHATMPAPLSSELHAELAFFTTMPEGADPHSFSAAFEEMYPGAHQRATAILADHEVQS